MFKHLLSRFAWMLSTTFHDSMTGWVITVGLIPLTDLASVVVLTLRIEDRSGEDPTKTFLALTLAVKPAWVHLMVGIHVHNSFHFGSFWMVWVKINRLWTMRCTFTYWYLRESHIQKPRSFEQESSCHNKHSKLVASHLNEHIGKHDHVIWCMHLAWGCSRKSFLGQICHDKTCLNWFQQQKQNKPRAFTS